MSKQHLEKFIYPVYQTNFNNYKPNNMDIIIQNLHLSINSEQAVKCGFKPYSKENCPDGVYICSESGKLWLPQFWGLSEEKEDAIAFLKGKTRLLIALEGSDKDIELLPRDKRTILRKFGSENEALTNYSGMDNQDELCKHGSESAMFCRNKRFEYRLPTLAEMNDIFSEKKLVDSALTLAGGEPFYCGWHWTSTRNSNSLYWFFDWSFGDRGRLSQSYDLRVRPVSSFL